MAARILVNKLGGGHHRCYICQKRVVFFLPYKGGLKELSDFIREMKVIGSDVTRFSCPHCWCHDRERHLFIYFDKLDLWKKFAGGKVLHLAPESHLRKKLEQMQLTTYVMGDLYPTDKAITKVDVTNLEFDDSAFDVVICNHILEHVPDDHKALSEINRVLRHGGLAILQTPFSSLLEKTFEDNGIVTDRCRLVAYGQEDHIRLYGKDLFAKIANCGFDVQIIPHPQELAFDADIFGVNQEESLLLGWKK